MYNARKRRLVSKRHSRRIIANNTEIDIAGCSKSILDYYTVNTSYNICNKTEKLDINNAEKFDINNACTNTIHIDNTTTRNHDKCQGSNIQRDSSNCILFSNDSVKNDEECNDNYNDNTDKEKLRNALATWAISYNIPHNACNALLKILCQYTSYNLPIDTRTLLQTPRQTNIMKVCGGGEYFHFGLHDIIKQMLSKNNDKCFNLLINIDSLPVAKSSQASLWLILCSNTVNKSVYLVGAYFGYTKPNDSKVFLQYLVYDLIKFINDGNIHNGNIIKVTLFALICDAPAKSFALCIKGHMGFNSCTKCLVKGKYTNGRICFPYEKQYSLRTDELFAVNVYKDFQIGFSILNNVPKFLPLTNTPLDYMHLICLGVVKKIILLWMKGPRSIRLNPRSINKISHLLILLRNTIPDDFVRRPRSIRDVKQWKATEFRTFLLYTGPVVLRNILQDKLYIHFLTLHVAITILTRQNLCQEELINFAESLLHHFVQSFEILYGKQYISHNVHNLLHICSDVRTYGPLDKFSAFRFENYMTFIKRRLRKNDKPLQQLTKRYSEIANCDFFFVEHDNNSITSCKYVHKNGPILDRVDVESQYFMIFNGIFNINCKSSSNNCCLLRNGKCILIVNIIQTTDKEIYLIGKQLKYVKDLYTLPCQSSDSDIKVMKLHNDNIYSWPITDVLCKAWKMPYENDKNTFVIFPLNHEI